MNSETLIRIQSQIRAKKNLIHCITNPISMNQCANAVLAVGCRPIMAEHPSEVSEITKASQALLLNLGNITDAKISSMRISCKTAKKFKIPIVLDAVGVACSKSRRCLAYELIALGSPTIIKGNYSEIKALYNKAYKSAGVDSEHFNGTNEITSIAVKLSEKYNSIILASGKTDIITNGSSVFYIKNGTKRLADITGTGCMLGALATCFASVSSGLSAAVASCALLGICGELSDKAGLGSFSFLISLLDRLSLISESEIITNFNMEEINIEKT